MRGFVFGVLASLAVYAGASFAQTTLRDYAGVAVTIDSVRDPNRPWTAKISAHLDDAEIAAIAAACKQ